MKLLKIEKTKIGKFLTPYKAVYQNEKGQIKEYEMISRDKNLTTDLFGAGNTINAVGIIAFNNDLSKILLQKEFRLACNSWVYNFPGGLIDEEETPDIAAKRELKEETGLDITEVIDTMNPSYVAVGMTDESVYTVICKADGNITASTSPDEEIEAGWFSKNDIKALFRSDVSMSQRTQSFLWMWCFGEALK